MKNSLFTPKVLLTLTLGQCSTRAEALHKAFSWVPGTAKSFRIDWIERYKDGIGRRTKDSFRFHVTYFSNLEPGAVEIVKEGNGQWHWHKYCLNKERFQLKIVPKK